MPGEPEPVLNEGEWRRQHDEISKNVARVASLLGASCLFCVLTLGAPDATLISTDAKIRIPFVNNDVSYLGFLLFGPLVLIGQALYLHVFIEQLIRLGVSKNQYSLPFVFNIGRPAARVVSMLMFYWMLPSVLAVFAWKALPRPDAPLFIVVTTLTMVAMLLLQIRRFGLERSNPRTIGARILFGGLWLFLILLLVASISLVRLTLPVVAWMWSGELTNPPRQASALIPTRTLQLYGVPLDKKNLSGVYAPSADMRKADLREADLEGAILTHADLRKADLTSASLAGADLSDADLRGAVMTDANLFGANLQRVIMDDFTQVDVKWRKVACILGNDMTACLKQDGLAWSDLGGARLRGADLTKAQNLVGSDLRYTDLSDANLTGVDLRLADLRHTLLPASAAKAKLDGSLRDATPQTEARAFVSNRTTDSCLQAPQSPDNFTQPRISRIYPCVKTREAPFQWLVRRVNNGYLSFRSAVSNRAGLRACVDGTGGTYENARVQMWQCNDDYDNQYWRIILAHDGFVMISKRDTGFCLNSTGSREFEPSPVLTRCNPDDHNQHWNISIQ